MAAPHKKQKDRLSSLSFTFIYLVKRNRLRNAYSSFLLSLLLPRNVPK